MLFPVIGKSITDLDNIVQKLTTDQIQKIQDGKAAVPFKIGGKNHVLYSDCFHIEDLPEDHKRYAFGTTRVNGKEIAVWLDTEITEDLRYEGISNELIHEIQQKRKEMGLEVSDRIHVIYDFDSDVQLAVSLWDDVIKQETLAETLTPGLIKMSEEDKGIGVEIYKTL